MQEYARKSIGGCIDIICLIWPLGLYTLDRGTQVFVKNRLQVSSGFAIPRSSMPTVGTWAVVKKTTVYNWNVISMSFIIAG